MKLITKKIIAREFLILLSCVAIGFFSFAGTYFYNLYFENKKDNLKRHITVAAKTIDSLSQNEKKPNILSYTSNGVPIFRIEKEFTYLYNSDEKTLIDILNQMNKTSKSENEIKFLVTNFIKLHSLKLDTVYFTKDGQQVTKSQLLASGYIESRIMRGINNGILTAIGITKDFSKEPNGLPIIFSDKNISKISLNSSNYINTNLKLNSKEENKKQLTSAYEYSNAKILSLDNRIEFSTIILIISGIFLFFIRYLLYGIAWSLKVIKQRE